MLIPQSAACVAAVAAKEATRYSFNAVCVERKNGKPRCIATDGRRAMIAEWEEVDGDQFPAVFADNPKNTHDDTFTSLVPAKALPDAAKSIGKISRHKPVLECIALDEPSANGKVRIATTDLERISSSEVATIEGNFPPLDDFPAPIPVRATCGDEKDSLPSLKADEHPDKDNLMRWGAEVWCNATYLREMLAAIEKGCGKDASVKLIVPLVVGKPIHVEAKAKNGDTHGLKIHGLLMPINPAA